MNDRDLQKKIESQHNQIKLYERKLRDVVRAYKSLEIEKTALQDALESLFPKEAAGQQPSPSDTDSAIESVKAAIATLTREYSKKEAAFQNDKKALLDENASLREQLKKASEKLAIAERNFKNLKATAQQVDVDRERELIEHGKVLTEMQTEYAKEHQSLEATTEETAALTKKLSQKDEMINHLKEREAQLICQVSTLSKEVKELTEKAYHVPSVQILKDELANLKVDHARELVEAVVKAKHAAQVEEQNRASAKIAELEEKTMILLEKVAQSEESRKSVHDAFVQSEMEKAVLVEELCQLRRRHNGFENSEPTNDDVVTRLQLLVTEIREKNPGVDIFALIGPDEEKIRLKDDYRDLKEECDHCKSRLEILTASNAHVAVNTSGSKEDTLRGVAEEFQTKIQKLISVHAKDRALYEKSTRDLHARISELEQREGRIVTEMRREMNTRISEMEAEMQKQRSRAIDVVAEKEREIDVARSVLASFHKEQMSAPADPSQAGKITLSKRRSTEHKIYANRSCSTDGSSVTIPGANEPRNIFYEEELLKKDRELQEVRSLSHQLDYRLREVEQAALVKELEHQKKTQAMSEEITKLQSRLGLLATGGEMEYLRNIFVQFIRSNNSSTRKNILKAMGMALKLSTNEMMVIDSK
uniref:GRIP domain containing protein n=2 Tax=Haemonchus contortus TaxID=6289 RepID=A0A7I4XUU0_HAECO